MYSDEICATLKKVATIYTKDFKHHCLIGINKKKQCYLFYYRDRFYPIYNMDNETDKKIVLELVEIAKIKIEKMGLILWAY